MITPAEIAKKLTPAQRKALLWLPANGSSRQEDGKDGKSGSLYGLRGKQLQPFIRATLASGGNPIIVDGRWGKPDWAATKLGLAVRKVLDDEMTREPGERGS